MMDTEAFREFKTGLSLLRDNYSAKALQHIQRAAELEKNNPYYMSYLGVALARTERKWADAERMCDTAVHMKRNQAQLYLNLAEVYMAAGRKEDAREALIAGMKYALEHRHGQAHAAALADFLVPGTQASVESPLRNAAPPDAAGHRQDLRAAGRCDLP